MVDVLVVGTHPDDIELGFGGAVALFIAQGYDVALLDLTNGEPTPFGDPKTRAKESSKAAEILGVKSRITLDLPNRELVDNVASRRKVAEIYRKLRPELVFLQGEQDAHPDHIEGSKIAWKARFDAKLTKTDMAGEPWYPKKMLLYYASHLPHIPDPAFILDVSEVFDKKIDACKEYRSQLAATGREKEYIDRLLAAGLFYGSMIGAKYGEPVFLRDELGLKNIRDIIR